MERLTRLSQKKFCLSLLNEYSIYDRISVCHNCKDAEEQLCLIEIEKNVYHLDRFFGQRNACKIYSLHLNSECKQAVLPILPRFFNVLKNVINQIELRNLDLVTVAGIYDHGKNKENGTQFMRGSQDIQMDCRYFNSFPIFSNLIQGLLDLNITQSRELINQMIIDVKKHNIKRTYKKWDPKITITKKRALYKVIHSILHARGKTNLDNSIDKVVLRPNEINLINSFLNQNLELETKSLKEIGVPSEIEDTLLETAKNESEKKLSRKELKLERTYTRFTNNMLLKNTKNHFNRDQAILYLHTVKFQKNELARDIVYKTPVKLLERAITVDNKCIFFISTKNQEFLIFNKANFINLFNRHLDWIKFSKYRKRKLNKHNFIEKSTCDLYRLNPDTDSSIETILERIKEKNVSLYYTAQALIKILKRLPVTSRKLPKIFGLKVPEKIKEVKFKSVALYIPVLSSYTFHINQMKLMEEIHNKVNKISEIQFEMKEAPKISIEDAKKALIEKFKHNTIKTAKNFLKNEKKDQYELRILLSLTKIKNKEQNKLIQDFGEEAIKIALKEIFFEDS
jgi:hypothetical protein